MAHLKGQMPVYYYVLQGNSNILADERDKKKLLDIVLGACQAEPFEVYAFCITNDRLCMILGAAGKTELNQSIRRAASEFEAYRSGECRGRTCTRDAAKLTVTHQRSLRSQRELRERCRELHLLPVLRGYAAQPENYWWSSYRMYLGYYEWRGVTCSRVLQLFSGETTAARRQFRRFHEAGLRPDTASDTNNVPKPKT